MIEQPMNEQPTDDQPTNEDGLAGESDASPEDIAAYYDAWARATYDQDVAAWGYEAPRQVAAMVADHLGEQRSAGLVLDAGCGTGGVGDALRQAGVERLVGGDFTPASVAAARKRGIYETVDHLDLNAPLDFGDGHFAASVSVGVFSYVQDTAFTIDELLRVTRPGGVVIFTQRTDLWDKRGCPAIIDRLIAAGRCVALTSEPAPYLPGHPEFADDIGIIYTTLTRR